MSVISVLLLFALTAVPIFGSDTKRPQRDANDENAQPLFSYATSIVHGETKDGKPSMSNIKVNFHHGPMVPVTYPKRIKSAPKVVQGQTQIVTPPEGQYLGHQLQAASLAYSQQLGQPIVVHAQPQVHQGIIHAQPLVQAHAASNIRAQPQLFNVGYSIGIATDPEPKLKVLNPQTFRQQKLLHGDIITGSPKDKVVGPSGINSGYPAHQHPQYNHNHIETTSKPNIFHHYYFPQEQQVYSGPKYIPEYGWKNPEIYRQAPEHFQSSKFDHAGALGRSEGFDQSNVMDVQPTHVSSVQRIHQEVPQPGKLYRQEVGHVQKQSVENASPAVHPPQQKFEYDKTLMENFLKNYKPVFFHPEITLPVPSTPKVNLVLMQKPAEDAKRPDLYYQKVLIDPKSIQTNAGLIYVKKYQPVSGEYEKYATEPYFPPETKEMDHGTGYHSLDNPVEEKQADLKTEAPGLLNSGRQGRIASPEYRYYQSSVRNGSEKNYHLQTLLRPPPMRGHHKY